MIQAYLDAQISAKTSSKSTTQKAPAATTAVQPGKDTRGGTETKDHSSQRRKTHSDEDKNNSEKKNDAMLPAMNLDEINKIELPVDG